WRRVLHRRAAPRPAPVDREARRCRRAAAPVRRDLPACVGARGVRAQPGTGPARQGGVGRHMSGVLARRGLAAPMTGARKEPVVFVEPDARPDADAMVSLERDWETGETQIVVADIRDESLLVFPL